MTPDRRLRARPGWRPILMLGLLVLGLHLAALDWLRTAFHPVAAGRLPEPIYTVLLKPTPPPKRLPASRPPSPAPHPAAQPRPAPQRLAQTKITPTPIQPKVEALASPAPASEPSAPQQPASTPSLPELARSLGDEPPGGNVSRVGAPAQAAATASAPRPAGSAPSADVPPWPPSTKLSYTITGHWRGDLHGSGALVWTVDGNDYDATLSGRALISFAYRSTGHIDGDWLAPTRYTERVFTREKSIDFDRATHTLHFSAISDVLPLQSHVQDSASLFLQLAHRLTTDPNSFHPGATLTFAVARPSGMTDWTFTIAGLDTVATPAGSLQCWHVVRQATQANELGAQIWLSPQLQNLPVQIRLQQSADSYLLFTLDHAEQQTPPSAAFAPP